MSLLAQSSLQTQMLLIATAVCLVAAISDYRTGHIPNWLTFGTLILGTGAQILLSHRAYPSLNVLLFVVTSLAGIILTGLVPLLLWKKNALGGGDLKLLVAMGALLGPLLGMQVQLYAFLFALVIAPAKLAYEGKLLRTLKNATVMVANPFRAKGKRVAVPAAALTEYRFGPAIFLAAVASTLTTF